MRRTTKQCNSWSEINPPTPNFQEQKSCSFSYLSTYKVKKKKITKPKKLHTTKEKKQTKNNPEKKKKRKKEKENLLYTMLEPLQNIRDLN